MTNGWEILRLGDLSERITKGTTPKKFTSSGIKYFKAECLSFSGSMNENKFSFIDCSTHEKLKRSMLEEGDILISIAGMNLGKVGVVKKHHLPANTNQAVGIIRLHDKSSVRFLKYALLNPKARAIINSISGQAAQPNINLTQISNLKISFPSKDLQTKIASILSAYDDLIENNLKRIKLLEEKAQLTYEEWFVRMKYPGHENDVVDSETGLPEGWISAASSSFFDITIGKTPPRKETIWFNQQNGVKWASIKDMKNSGMFLSETSETISIEANEKFNFNHVKKGNVMLSFKLSVGEVSIAAEDMTTNEAIAHFNPKNEFKNISSCYTYLYLKNFNFHSLGSTSSIGTALNSKIVKRMPFTLPGKTIIESFDKNISKIFTVLLNLNSQNEKLKVSRNLLLPRLMSGMIDIDEIKYNYPKETLV